MTAISFRDASNVGDGLHALLEIEGVPSGTLRVYYAAIPDFSQSVPAAFSSPSPFAYRVIVPRPGDWYFWIEDDDGRIESPKMAWVSVGDEADAELTAASIRLTEVIQSHQEALEKALRSRYHEGTTIKHIGFGSAAAITDWPAILVTKPRVSINWVAFPLLREWSFTLEVFTFVVHQDRASQTEIGGVLTGRLVEILNKREYETLETATGASVQFCSAVEGDVQEVEVDEKTWVALGSIVWTGRAILGA